MAISSSLAKATIHASTSLREFTKDGISVSIVLPPIINSGALELWLTASKDGEQLLLNNPYLFMNPPVDKASTRIEYDEILKQMIIDAVTR